MMGRHAGNTHMQTVLGYVEENPRCITEQIAASLGMSTKDVSGILYRLKLQGLAKPEGRQWSAVAEDAPRQIVTQTWENNQVGHWVDFAICAPRQLQEGKTI